MARRYDDSKKAAVYVALLVNNNNIRRTSINTDVPEATVRDWRTTWEREGVPPEVLELSEQIAGDFVAEAEIVRDMALQKLKEAVESGEVKPAQLVTTVGMLEDKIRLGKGLATSRSETVASLPPPEELRKMLGNYIYSALDQARQREEDINDVDVKETIPTKELSVRPTGG